MAVCPQVEVRPSSGRLIVAAIGFRGRALVTAPSAWAQAPVVPRSQRFDAAGAWGELASVLRLRLDVETDAKERKRLFVRIVDIEERALDRPEQAMVTLARALGEDPADVTLRERAERLSVRLHDLESLLGLYEDLIEQLAINNPQRFQYALRTGELYEGGVGQPLRAADFYDLAFQAAAAQQMPPAERLKILERIERLYRAVGEPQKLAQTLKRKAELAPDAAGLHIVGWLPPRARDRAAAAAAQAQGVDVTRLSRYSAVRPKRGALLLGYAAFDERAIRAGVHALARALSSQR